MCIRDRVEAGAKEVSEEAMLGAIMFGHEHIKQLVAFQEEIAAVVGKEKMEVKLYTVDEAIDTEVRKDYEQAIREAVSIEKKLERYGKKMCIRDSYICFYIPIKTVKKTVAKIC